jgi:hypothetical protein
MSRGKLPARSSLDRSPEGIDSPANAYLAPSISGDALTGKPSIRARNINGDTCFVGFKYTGDAKILMIVDVDMYAQLLIVGQPENGAYEWVIVVHDKVEGHSDVGYGQRSIALRDGLIAYHGAP